MTDLEITRLCAEAMGHTLVKEIGIWCIPHPTWHDRDTSNKSGALKVYDPLHDDAQAMALVKKLGLSLRLTDPDWWDVWVPLHSTAYANNENLNRAICECVANMQKGKK